ncbi:UNVERIFIED_ORG: hypothetical protein HNP28_002729 [Comamonas terrigena]
MKKPWKRSLRRQGFFLWAIPAHAVARMQGADQYVFTR